MREEMLQIIFDMVYGLKGDFCLAVFLVGALVLGIGLSAQRPPVDSDQDNA